jgi:hypothetical protein
MFPNTIGRALDLDNLADRVLKPILKANGVDLERLACLSPRPSHEPA